MFLPAAFWAEAIIAQGFAMAYPHKGKDQGTYMGRKGKGESPRQGNRIRSVSQVNGLDWDELWEEIWELEEKWARHGVVERGRA